MYDELKQIIENKLNKLRNDFKHEYDEATKLTKSKPTLMTVLRAADKSQNAHKLGGEVCAYLDVLATINILENKGEN